MRGHARMDTYRPHRTPRCLLQIAAIASCSSAGAEQLQACAQVTACHEFAWRIVASYPALIAALIGTIPACCMCLRRLPEIKDGLRDASSTRIWLHWVAHSAALHESMLRPASMA